MKRSLVDLLCCPACGGSVVLVGDPPDPPDPPDLPEPPEPVAEGTLACGGCAARYPVRNRVPVLLPDLAGETERTAALYGDLWRASTAGGASAASGGYRREMPDHLELLRLAGGRELVEGQVGIDAGCGSGSAPVLMAERHPGVAVVGVELSPGVEVSAEAADRLEGAHLVRGDLLAPPLRAGRFDFAYSFGVLHHTRDPELAFRRLLGCLRPGAPVTIFLYKDFSDLPLKRLLLRLFTALRRQVVRLPPHQVRRVSGLLAPLVYLGLTLPARALHRAGAGRLARHIPYGFFLDVRSVANSLQDRLGAPFEFRFSGRDLEGWVTRSGLEEARVVDCIEFGYAGLVLSGRKPRTG